MTAGLLAIRRIRLLPGPTPLQPAPRLSAALGVQVWLKRDDLTGLALGGNKVRALEYLLADAVDAGCDSLVTGAGPQSNWAMLAATGSRLCGLDPHLVFYGDQVEPTGNALLAESIGADVRFTGDPERSSVDAGIDDVAAELRAAGRRPYVLPRGGAVPLGSLGYVRACVELTEQLLERGVSPRTVWLPTGSCGTHAGLLAGSRWLQLPWGIVGVTVSRPAPECRARIAALAAAAGTLAGTTQTNTGDGPAAGVTVLAGWMGPGYGKRSAAGEEAARLFARTEGVFVDPVFGAKAAAALVDAAARKAVDGPVIFLVTGGAPALFTTGSW